jgi:hypothetical protein
MATSGKKASRRRVASDLSAPRASAADFEASLGQALAPTLAEIQSDVRAGNLDVKTAAAALGYHIATSDAVRAALGQIAPARDVDALRKGLGALFADTADGISGKVKDALKEGKDAADEAKEAGGIIDKAKALIEAGKGGPPKTQEKPHAPAPQQPKQPPHPPEPGDTDTSKRPKFYGHELSFPFYAIILDRVIDHRAVPTPGPLPWSWHDRLHWVSSATVTYDDGTKSYSQLGSNDYELDSGEEARSEPPKPPSGAARVPDYGHGDPRRKIIDKDNILAMDPRQDGLIDWLLIPDAKTVMVQIAFNLYETSQSRELKELIGAIAQLANDFLGGMKGKAPGSGTSVDQSMQNAVTKLINFLRGDKLLMSTTFTFTLADLRAAFAGDPDLINLPYANHQSTVAYISKQGFDKARPAAKGGPIRATSGWAILLSRVSARKKEHVDLADDDARAIAWQSDASARQAAIDDLYSMQEIWVRIERHPPLDTKKK